MIEKKYIIKKKLTVRPGEPVLPSAPGGPWGPCNVSGIVNDFIISVILQVHFPVGMNPSPIILCKWKQ